MHRQLHGALHIIISVTYFDREWELGYCLQVFHALLSFAELLERSVMNLVSDNDGDDVLAHTPSRSRSLPKGGSMFFQGMVRDNLDDHLGGEGRYQQ